jgi:glycosyltransferase involved in cell wall biosynthesis
MTIGFLGHMGYPPNISAVLRLHDRLFLPMKKEIPELRLKIIGHWPGSEIRALESDDVEVTGTVESIWPHLAEVNVMVFPMEIGGGLQNKILESLAADRAVVTTSISAIGCGEKGLEYLVVADTDEDLRAATLALLRDSSRRSEAVGKGRELLRFFDWDEILPRYEKVVFDL